MTHQRMISIIIPVFNEQSTIVPLITALHKVLEQLPYQHEILFVDDGSTDATGATLRTLAAADQRIKFLRLSRNFGHQAALSAGMAHVSGQATIMMDGDMQHPPELLPRLIAEWEQGYEVVYTTRIDTTDASWIKWISSAFFYRLINAFSDISIQPNAADFRLLDRTVVNHLLALPEKTRFLRGLVSWVGFRQQSVPYTAHRRPAGRTKYSWRRMMRLATDGIASFSSFPLYISVIIGAVIACGSFLYALWIIYEKYFLGALVPGWATIMVALLCLCGIQLSCLGIIGAYIGRIYIEVKNRPLYVVAEQQGLSTAATEQEHESAEHR